MTILKEDTDVTVRVDVDTAAEMMRDIEEDTVIEHRLENKRQRERRYLTTTCPTF
jgi:hypothetical protein